MKRSRLRSKANKSNKHIDIGNYKRQYNHVVKLNRQSKENWFLNLNNTDDPKPFLKTCMPYFSNKHGKEILSLCSLKKKRSYLRIKKLQVNFMRILVK